MSPSEVHPPGGRYSGKHRVYATSSGRRGWTHLCRSHSGVMRRCYVDIADRPFPRLPSPRHHQLKGRQAGFWEWEVGGGMRVRYQRNDDGDPVVVYAGPAPPDTH